MMDGCKYSYTLLWHLDCELCKLQPGYKMKEVLCHNVHKGVAEQIQVLHLACTNC